MKKLYLHIGFHKTASTSFQTTCANNLEAMASQGYLYPLFSRGTFQDLHNHSAPLQSAFSKNPALMYANVRHGVEDVEASNRECLDHLSECLGSEHDVILSGEGVSIMTRKELDDLLSFLGGFDREVIPIAGIRSPYQFHYSSVQQGVVSGKECCFTKLRPQMNKIRKIMELFGENIVFFPFSESCCHAQGPAGYLMELCGVDCSAMDFININFGFGNACVRVQNALNAKAPIVQDGEANPAFVQLQMLEARFSPELERADFSTVNAEKFYLTGNELKEIREGLEQENAFLRETFGEAYCDKDYPTARDIGFAEALELFPELTCGMRYLPGDAG